MQPNQRRPVNALIRHLLVVLPAIVPACVPAARAQALPTVHLESLTWVEVSDQLRSGHTTILLPLGGTEQNGPAMALGKHNARARLLAEKIAQRLGNALVAPVVAYVPEGNVEPPSGHMRFAGTITIPPRTFESLLEAAARSFERHGFRDIVLLADSGGYQKQMDAVARRPPRATRVHALHEYYRQRRRASIRSWRSADSAARKSAPMPGSPTPH